MSNRDYSKMELEQMLLTCREEVMGRGAEFIESLYEQFMEKEFLTEKQIDALKKFYDNCKGD